MKNVFVALAIFTAPVVARAGGLIDTTGVEKDMRDAQKKVKGDVDTETDKHSVKVGDDGKKDSGKSGKKSKKVKKSEAPAK